MSALGWLTSVLEEISIYFCNHRTTLLSPDEWLMSPDECFRLADECFGRDKNVS